MIANKKTIKLEATMMADSTTSPTCKVAAEVVNELTFE
jgi:hypothetical protein